jgi:glycosyltransferase involved in cell wall biosynthesis
MLIQQGARRNYSYALQLENAGLLHSLITDAAWTADKLPFPLRIALKLAPRLAGPIARRRVFGISRDRLRASLLPHIARSVSGPFLSDERVFAIADEALALPNRIRGLKGARIVVNYQGNGGSFLPYAKRRGALIVTDFIITPKYIEIEKLERERWPGWENSVTPQSVIEFYGKRISKLLELSDIYLCPSNTVACDLADFSGFKPDRVRVVPYGLSNSILVDADPQPGRVLFAGAAGLRKGIPYLAKAATLLKKRHPEISIVVAGGVTPTIRSRAETKDLNFLGALDKKRIAVEFAQADVFCLPSLAEGSATVIFEALAAGLPIITTHSSGSVIRDGVEGIVVPERNAEAIAESIARIVNNRALRAAMSVAAIEAAARYSDDACGQAFIDIIRACT